MKKNWNLKNIFLVFIILQPILDCYLLYSDKVINMIGFSPTTIIRMVLIAAYSVWIYLTTNRGRKAITIYLIIYLIYFLIHHYVCIHIDEGLMYETFKYSLSEEVFYFIRMLLPVLVIYIVYAIDYTKKDTKWAIFTSSLIASLIIIVLNITGLSLTSYGSHQISGNIFNWFDSSYKAIDLASKGWFNSANQIGATIIILITLCNYFTLKDPNKKHITITALLIFASMMIGTRTATIIVCYILIVMFISYLIISKIHNRKKSIKSILINVSILVFTLVIYGIAPVANCKLNNYVCLVTFDNGLDSSDRIKLKKNLKYEGDVCNFLPETPTNPEYYEKIYPCSDNEAFWDNYARNKMYKFANNRTLELLVTKDVYKRIASPEVSLFGMSRSRFLTAEMYLEKDVYVHYYTLGIIGIIIVLIIPYVVPCLMYGIMVLREKYFRAYCLTMCASIMALFLASYMSGHILDELIVTIYMGFVVGILLSRMYPPKEKELTDNVLIVTDECMMGGVSVLLEDILNNIDKRIKIDLLILHNHGTRLKNLGSNVNVIYGTKFFNVIDLNIKEVLKTKNIVLIIKKIILVCMIKTGFIKYKIMEERGKILSYRYKKEIAFKDGFCGLFTGYGDSLEKIQWLHSDYAKSDFSSKYRKQFIKLYENFDKCVAVSKPAGESFNKIYHCDDKMIIINNIVDTDKIKKKAMEKEIKYSEKLNLVSVGRLHSDKCFDKVINALIKLRDDGKLNNIKYRIVGDGYEYDNLKTLIKDNNMEDYIELLGNLENPYPVVAASQLYIMSSNYESFGLVVVEALSLGVPVLSVEIAAIKELLSDEYGVIISNNGDSLYDELKKIISNPDMISKWHKNLKTYSYNNKTIIDAINNLLKEGEK